MSALPPKADIGEYASGFKHIGNAVWFGVTANALKRTSEYVRSMSALPRKQTSASTLAALSTSETQFGLASRQTHYRCPL